MEEIEASVGEDKALGTPMIAVIERSGLGERKNWRGTGNIGHEQSAVYHVGKGPTRRGVFGWAIWGFSVLYCAAVSALILGNQPKAYQTHRMNFPNPMDLRHARRRNSG